MVQVGADSARFLAFFLARFLVDRDVLSWNLAGCIGAALSLFKWNLLAIFSLIAVPEPVVEVVPELFENVHVVLMWTALCF